MDMIKSLIVSTLVIASIVAICMISGKIQDGQRFQKQYDLAKAEFEKYEFPSALRYLREEPPKNLAQDYYSLKFDILLNMERLNDAKEAAEKLVAMDGNNAFSHYLMSIAYYNLADYDNCEKCLQKAVKLDPKNTDYKIDLAGFYSDFHKDEQAIKCYKEVIKEDPKYEFAWTGIATIYENEKNYKKALEYRKQAVEKFPKNVYDVYMLAELYSAMGDKKDAALSYKKAAEIDVNKESEAQVKYTRITGKALNMGSGKINQSIPASIKGDLVIVETSADGAKGKFLVDNNVTDTVLYERFLRKNNIKSESGEYGVYTLINGRRRPAPTSYMDIKLGDLSFYDSRVFILPDNKGMKYDGIIGNDILAKANVSVDKKNHVVVIKSLN